MMPGSEQTARGAIETVVRKVAQFMHSVSGKPLVQP